MKKLIAVILAVLLLGSAVAFAESAPALNMKDPVLEITKDGETALVDLNGLTLRIGALEVEDESYVVLNILGNDELLFRAAACGRDGRVLIAADGLSHSFAVPLVSSSESAPAAAEAGEEEPSLADALLAKLMESAEVGYDGDAITFHVPYTATNDLLREMLPMLKSVPNAEELLAQLDELEAQGNGFELNGTLAMSEGLHIVLGITPVSEGTAADSAAFQLRLDADKHDDGLDFVAALSVPAAGEGDVFRLEGTVASSDDGMSAHFAVYLPVSDADEPAAALDLAAATVDLEVGKDFSFRVKAGESVHLEAAFDHEAGTVLLDAAIKELGVKLTAAAVKDEAELSLCDFPEDVIELGSLSEEENDALGEELQNALGPVLEFVAPALQQSGLLG